MNYWLLKTEPSDYAYADLAAQGGTVWDGVANAQAVNFIAQMQPGDRCVLYHTGDERRVAGIAEVTTGAYVDPRDGTGKLKVVDVVPVRICAQGMTLAAIKAHPLFVDSPLVRQGRLSVVPLSEGQYAILSACDGL
jgi:predicted RNA-binding protein with PUA-like domain